MSLRLRRSCTPCHRQRSTLFDVILQWRLCRLLIQIQITHSHL